VLATGVITGALAFLTGEAAARRGDARVLRLSIVFFCAAGFLGLHALATPGVLLAGKNAGFQVASAIGLLLAAPIAGWSALESEGRGAGLLGRRGYLYGALGLLMALWAAVSLATVPPLDEPIEDPGPLLLGLFAVGAVIYGLAAVGYVRLYRRRKRPLLLSAVAAFVLLAEAMLAIGVAHNWHATWWEWHLLMLVAFALVARAAWKEWQVEGSTAEIFSDVYEERTRGRQERISVFFADLQGFTSYAERTPEGEVRAMLDTYFTRGTQLVGEYHGSRPETTGDELMAVFRDYGHELRAAKMGLEFQREMARIAEEHSDWPRFRVGINSGDAFVGVIDAPGARSFAVTGDTVNLASRLEGQARAGEVVIGEATYAALQSQAEVEDLGELPVKGKERPVRAYVLRGLAPDRNQGDQRLQHQQSEADR
jgi:adenylate cyclase